MEYTDMERRILDIWPKFEDGSYVWFGDAYIDTDDDENEAVEVLFSRENVDLVGLEGFYTGFNPSERVKRPAPKVLDADGVEIKVGDRVYSICNGDSYIVRAINGSGTLEFEGFEYKGWFPTIFTHTQPAIDADGVLIKVGDKVWVDGVSESCEVAKVESGIVQVRYADGDTFECCSSDLTHEQPESWERLEKDARQLDINLNDTTDDYPRMNFARDLIRRAKALAEKEAAR